MLGQQVPGPRQGQRCCLVPGQEKRHRFIAQLLIAHADAGLLVARTKKEREEIAESLTPGPSPGRRGEASSPALADDAEEDGVELLQGAAHAEVGGGRNPERQRHEAVESLQEIRLHHFHRLRDRVRHAADLRAEQRARRDVERQAHHLRVNVAPVPRLPLGHHTLRRGHHRRAIALDAAVQKHRLDQAALSQPKIAVAGEEPLAEHERIEPQGKMFDEAFALGDEHFLDRIGMGEEIDVPMGEAQLDDIAEVAGAMRQEIEAFRAEVRQVAAQPMSFRTVRHTRLSHDACQAPG